MQRAIQIVLVGATGGELSRLQTAKTIMLRFQTRLREHLSDHASRASRLAEMSRAQEFLSSSRDLDTTSMGGQLWESLNRLRMLGQRIDSAIASVSADHRPGLLQQFEGDAVSATDSFYALVQTIDPMIDNQMRLIRELKASIQNVTK